MERFIQASVYGNKFINLSEKRVSKIILEQVNQIQIQINNVSNNNNLLIYNNLEEDEEIPDIDEEQTKVSVIYIYYPIGDTEAHLTTEAYAKLIECYPPFNWKVKKAFHPEYGTYFKLAPISDDYLKARECTFIGLNNIIATGTSEKLVYVAVKFINITPESSSLSDRLTVGYTNNTDFLPYFKTKGEYRIVDFSSNKTIVSYGDTIVLQWKVVGQPQQLLLTPGDFELRTSNGELSMEIYNDTTIRLYAIGDNKQVSQPINIEVNKPTIHSFTTNPTDSGEYKFGDTITFKYDVSGTDQVYMNQGIGLTNSNVIEHIFSPILEITKYDLMCKTKEGLISESIAITCTDLLLVEYKIIPNGNVYLLNWTISNGFNISVRTSDHSVDSTEAVGTVTFKSDAQNLTLTISCVGTANQSYHKEITMK